MHELTKRPIFFERNRVFRVYLGGKLFHNFFGTDLPEDNNLPEEWIASDVQAINPGERPYKEGISKVRGTDVYLTDLIENEKLAMLGEGRDGMGVLVKMLDSAIRLPIQTHPSKDFSRKYFNSPYGKTESWLIVDTRENAKIYFGFKEGVTYDEFLKAIEESETERDMMERYIMPIPVKKGDCFLIPAKTVHAIGAGCLILETQEPTDFTIQPEPWCGDYHLSEQEKYIGLEKELALQCFDFDMCGQRAVDIATMHPKVIRENEGSVTELLIGPDNTDCFSVLRHTVKPGAGVSTLSAPATYVVTDGEGEIVMDDGFSAPLKKGEYFFLPAAIKDKCTVKSNSSLELIECVPPEV